MQPKDYERHQTFLKGWKDGAYDFLEAPVLIDPVLQSDYLRGYAEGAGALTNAKRNSAAVLGIDPTKESP